jgi:hypothetical protein
MVVWKLPAEVSSWVTSLSQVLHRRLAWRLLPLLVGLLFAQGRKTVTSWLRAVAIGKGFQRYYYFLGSLGRQTASVAAVLLRRAVAVLPVGERILLGLRRKEDAARFYLRLKRAASSFFPQSPRWSRSLRRCSQIQLSRPICSTKPENNWQWLRLPGKLTALS